MVSLAASSLESKDLAILEYDHVSDTPCSAAPKTQEAPHAFPTCDACCQIAIQTQEARIDFEQMLLTAGLSTSADENAEAGSHGHKHQGARFRNGINAPRIRRLPTRRRQLRERLGRDKLEGDNI